MIPSPAQTQRQLSAWLPAICAAALALALYAIDLRATYIYDDQWIVLRDKRLQDPSRWGELWTDAYFPGAPDHLWRPLTSTTLAVQTWLAGKTDALGAGAWQFHLFNILTHVIASALTAELARRLIARRSGERRGIAGGFIAGLLFAAHPVHVEAVATIVNRGETLCAIGVLAALGVLVGRALTPARAVVIAALFLLAVLSKDQGILLPTMIVTWWLTVWMHGRAERGRIEATEFPRPAKMTLLLLMLFCTSGYLLVRESVAPMAWDRYFLEWVVNPIVRAEGAARWLVPIEILGRYVGLLIAPIHLSLDYGWRVTYWTVRWDQPWIYIGLGAIVAWAAGMIAAIRMRDRAAAFSLVCLAMLWGLVSNIPMLIGTIMGERLLYLPSAFFLILLAIPLSRLPAGPLAIMLAVLLTLASVRTVTYARLFENRARLYGYVAQSQPDSMQAHVMWAVELHERDDLTGADRIMRDVRRRFPEYSHVWSYSALVAMEMGRLDEAERYLDEAEKWLGKESPDLPRGLRDKLFNYRAAAAAAAAAATGPSTAPATATGAP